MAIDPRFFEQARSFITETMKSVVPTVNVDGGSAVNALLARGGATITATALQEIEHLLTTRDLTDPEAITEADMDLLLENLLTSRDGGDLAFGFVRLFYNDRVRREFAAGLTATIDDKSLQFLTISDLAFDPQDYFLDADNDRYFINVPFVAEAAGEEFNVDAGDINQLVNDTSGAVYVTNTSAFRNGREAQTNTQALRKAQRSVSTRTPIATDGAVFFMQDLFGAKLRDLLVVGNGDVEMLRDEVHDLGEGSEPRFQIGVDSLDPVTREQQGTPQNLHVGGRTDLYALFDGFNFVQQTVDLFADMTLDTDLPAPVAAGTTVRATIVEGTTGVVPANGKLFLDLGDSGEEVVAYSTRTAVDNDTYDFVLADPTTQPHGTGASTKAVNNNELTVDPDGDITVLPVFQIAEVRLLDPVTFEPVGSALSETEEDSKVPGWYVTRSNPYDQLSARETKTLVIDEKRDSSLYPGNQARSAAGGTTETVSFGGASRTKYTAPTDFTGYQGREITLSGGITTVTRTILQVLSTTEIVVSGSALAASAGDVDFTIASAYADYNEFPVRLSYYTNTELEEAQQFMEQDSRRTLTDDPLVRAFLPVFVDFTMRYRGDGTEAEIRDSVNEVLKSSAGEALGESTGAKFEYSDLINAAYTNGLANYVETPFQVRVRRLQTDGSVRTDYLNPNADTVSELAVRTNPGAANYVDDGEYSDDTNVFESTVYTFVVGDVGRKLQIEDVGLATIINVSGGNAELDVTFTGTVTDVTWSFAALFLETRRPTSVDEFVVPASGRLHLGAFTANSETVDYESVITESETEFTFILKEGQSINLPHAVDEPLRVSTSDYDDDNVIRDGVITDERTYRPFLGTVIIEQLT